MARRKTTRIGTPLSPKWDERWIEEVETIERREGRRICGAHTPAHTPCKLKSTHANGRCRYHGGHSNIGAPLGNRNAIIHGLYSRRLQRCGPHCPLWQTCPMPNKDLQETPEAERPHCPYEQEEYDNILKSLTASSDSQETSQFQLAENDGVAPSAHNIATFPDNPQASDQPVQAEGDILIYHNIATFQVMLTRAQAALSLQQYTEETRVGGAKNAVGSSKVNTLLQATLRIASELRQWLRLLASKTMRHARDHLKPAPANDESAAVSSDRSPEIREAQRGRIEEENGVCPMQSDEGLKAPPEEDLLRADRAMPLCCGPTPIWHAPEP